MIDPAFVKQSALGLIRNFGDEAAATADRLSNKYAGKKDETAAELWAAIGAAVRKLQKKR